MTGARHSDSLADRAGWVLLAVIVWSAALFSAAAWVAVLIVSARRLLR